VEKVKYPKIVACKPLVFNRHCAFPEQHPVLGVPADTYYESLCSPFHRSTVNIANQDDQQFRRMIDLSIPDAWTERWSYAYGEAETKAAEQLCKRLKGRTAAEVQQLLGKPACLGDSALCQGTSDSSTPKREFGAAEDEGISKRKRDTWLYVFGGRSMLVRPIFEGGLCVDATACYYEQDERYCLWRVRRLDCAAIGKSVSEILTMEGPAVRNTIGSLEKEERIAAFDAGADRAWRYQIGLAPQLLLFKKGRCTKVIHIGSCTEQFGERLGPWVYVGLDPVFRRP
jgi:hypothetical protein